MFERLFFDNELYNFLNVTVNSKVSWLLLNASGRHINEEGNFIKISKVEGSLSYIPKSKIKEDTNFSTEKGRVTIKVGRFVTKFISKESINEFGITPSDIESFVNIYKSYFTPDKNNMKIIEGEEILKWYLEDNYAFSNGARCGSLWNSCMRQSERNKFMKLYSKNPDLVKMLIFLSDDGKLRSRALLWQDVKDLNGTSYKIMDRIYSIYEQDVYLFKTWAKENGYITKLEQSAKCENLFDLHGIAVRIDCFVNLTNHQLSYYPYLDTFKYYNPRNGQFSNSSNFTHIYKLVQSSGGLEPHREEIEEEFYEDEHFDDEW